MAYANMVTEMSLIKSLVYKGKGKARENQQELTQYFGVTIPRSEWEREGSSYQNTERGSVA